jgi:uncharacterized protein involved in response to NO
MLSYGFRPFFLLGAAYAGLGILIWLPLLFGDITMPTAFSPLDWHIHEMLYGYLPAIVTGFLLTAIPNWTGRLPLQGGPLAVLAALWIAGRLAISVSQLIGALAAAVIDCSFLLLLAAAAAREVLAGRNWRNLPPLAIVFVFFAGNVVFHVEDHLTGVAALGTRMGVGAAIALIALIGGRVIPSFTHNWLVRADSWLDLRTAPPSGVALFSVRQFLAQPDRLARRRVRSLDVATTHELPRSGKKLGNLRRRLRPPIVVHWAPPG